MLRKIQKLKRCGIFQDFSWPSSGLEECKKFNLIFGWNGTGKSTLSGILRQLELRQRPDGDHVHLEWGSSVLRETDFSSAECSLKVFNSDFVDDTIEGELKPIAVFGKTNISKKKQLDALLQEAASLDRAIPGLSKIKEKAEKELDRFCIATAKLLKNTLGREGNTYSTYDKRRLKVRAEELMKLSADKRMPVSEDEQAGLLARTRSRFKDPVPKPTLSLPDIATLQAEVASLRKRSIVSAAIESLSSDHKLSRWVQEGMLLHEDRGGDTCLYCDQVLPKGRKESLEKHFSDALTTLQGDIKRCLEVLHESHRTLTSIELPKKAELVDHLAAKYPVVQMAAQQEIQSYSKAIKQLTASLEEKRERVFDSLPTDALDAIPSSTSWNKLLALLEEHNEASKNHAKDIAEAYTAYEKACVLDCLRDYEVKLKALAVAAEEYEKALRRNSECKGESRKLREELVSHKIPATQLTADLARYLGHSDLAFEAYAEGYHVMRRGEPARKLSDGEKTAIAVLYFLKTFADESFRLEDSVIVLDDPISSLDSNALYNAFSFIKDRSKHAKQLIILTHNFPFFRLVREWFRNLRGAEKRQWRIMMLEATCTSDGRCSAIVEIDPLLIAFDSEYQYLFGRLYALAATTGTPPLEQFLPVPNMARRVLEAFLAFKSPFPGDSSFHSRLEAVDNDEERRSRIYRFCNMQSHLNAVGDYDEDLSSLSGAPALLKDMLDLIKSADEEHYNGMVSCVTAGGS